MKLELSEKELEELANQLSCPSGGHGRDVAKLMNETNINMTLSTVNDMGLSDGQSILELGHGNAEHLSNVLKQAKNLTYCGLDISPLMKEEAERINSRFISGKVASFHLYDGTNIPFGAASFDRIFTVNTIYFWEQPLALLNELYRVLKPNGQCHITFAQKRFVEQLPFAKYKFELYDNNTVLKLIQQTSFRLIDIIDKTELVKSKTGEFVDREYAIVSLKK
ncbi:class I SAM-dependent methyltransferase [Aureispira anguillae]|uniref:Class I SAM-dependent methyltransferase n=1 Tax=Aureispira anguillae TaxID=2864201 RepID=A0A915VMM2_9BACT|nr:class I SAM-dependent methyltransferase [Aureispira anguillae]BDS09324.1 class I SAM-dependent methyltransferase [Aureispira anguillae]